MGARFLLTTFCIDVLPRRQAPRICVQLLAAEAVETKIENDGQFILVG